jgi:hypothetical protein
MSAIAICTNVSCTTWDGLRRYWVLDENEPESQYFLLDPLPVPNFCDTCGSGVIKACLNCDRPILLSELTSDFCQNCGERYRPLPESGDQTRALEF